MSSRLTVSAHWDARAGVPELGPPTKHLENTTMADQRCGCDRNQSRFTTMWTNAGLPAHIHSDGTTAEGGLANTDESAKYYAKELIASYGWLPRGWRP
jgi:hypothetical protein